MFRRQLWSFGKRGVKDCSIGPCDEQSGWIAFAIALDFTTRRIGRVLGVAASSQRRLVEQSAAIQMEDENRRVGRRRVDFLQCRHPALDKLEFAPTADHAYPLAGRRALRLFPEHA